MYCVKCIYIISNVDNFCFIKRKNIRLRGKFMFSVRIFIILMIKNLFYFFLICSNGVLILVSFGE